MMRSAGSRFSVGYTVVRCACVCALLLLASQASRAQPRFAVRMLQEAGEKELRVTLQARGTGTFGLGDGVVALAYDTLAYHRAELLRAPVFGIAPYREIELYTAGDSLYVGFFYDYHARPGLGARIGPEWTELAHIRFEKKTRKSPPMRLLPDAAAIVRDDGVELLPADD